MRSGLPNFQTVNEIRPGWSAYALLLSEAFFVLAPYNKGQPCGELDALFHALFYRDADDE